MRVENSGISSPNQTRIKVHYEYIYLSIRKQFMTYWAQIPPTSILHNFMRGDT